MKKTLTLISFLLWSATLHAFTTTNGKIYDNNNQQIALYGVNWFGFETQDHVLHGLWSRNWQEMLKQIKELGFTALRIPVCPATLQGVATNSINYSKNPDLQGLNSLQILDKFMAESDQLGLYILLDHHRPDCNAISTLWYTDSYSETQWLKDLAFMAERYKTNAHLIGIDLKNEPHGNVTWGTNNIATDWNTAAEKAAKTILNVNSNLLIFVEGIESATQCSGSTNHWWGGNLEPAKCFPLNIDKTKLVFAPHVYGPDVYQQPYFQDSAFPNNLETIWQTHFGFLRDEGFAVIVGEFGGRYGHGGNAKDKMWQDAFVNYLIKKEMRDFFYWSWNPNSGDTGGILQDDWQTVWDDKVALLRRLMDKTITTPVSTTPTNPPPTTNPTPITNPVSNDVCEIKYTVQSQWQNGMVINVILRNKGASDLKNWQITFNLGTGATISNHWSMLLSGNYIASPLDWNRTIAPNKQIEFGLQLAFNSLPEKPFELQKISCGNAESTSIPSSQNVEYQNGLQAGIALCQQNPTACNISTCNATPLFQPESGSVFLPRLGLTNDTNAQNRWDVVLQQIPNTLTFEVKSVTPSN